MKEIQKRELRNLQNDLELLVNEWKNSVPGEDEYYASETVTILKRIISIHQKETEKLAAENARLKLLLIENGIKHNTPRANR